VAEVALELREAVPLLAPMWQPERFWNADHGFGNGGSGNPDGKAATTGEETIAATAMAAATNKTREGGACEAIAGETRR
jgi:hypothetical protein